MVVLNDNEYFVVVLDLFDEFLYVVFCHPSAENVIVFFIVFHPGRELANVKVVGKLFQTVPGGDELGRPVGEHLAGLFVQVLDLQVHTGDLALQGLVCVCGRSLEVIFELDPFEMQGTEYGVHLLCFRRGNKISPVHETFIPLAFHEDRVQVIHEVFLHLVVEFHGDAAEPVCDVTVVQHLMDVAVHGTEGSDDLLFRTKLLDLFL